ncbi:hypothetical protein BJF79_48475 [Actinomadura sp. CNU-125]|nr:hypothetical protein BJF79_48475 [Actinomadura sp. CNU-125]
MTGRRIALLIFDSRAAGSPLNCGNSAVMRAAGSLSVLLSDTFRTIGPGADGDAAGAAAVPPPSDRAA